jgi:hypothetical protein
VARYRPIDVRLWSDRRFLSLSDEGKLLWVFLLTTPSTLSIPGVIIGGEASLSEQLGWSVEQFREQFQEIVRVGLKVRMEGRVWWLTNAMKYQPPKNPNAVKAWAKAWDEIPEVDLKRLIWQAAKIACKTWNILFTKLFPKQFGEQFGQLSLEQLDTGTVTRSGSGTVTRSETGSGSGSPAPPAIQIQSEPALTLVPLPIGCDPDREKLKREVVAVIGPKHAEAFARVKAHHKLTGWGPSVIGKFEELRELLDSMPVLDDAMERCEYALKIQETQAMEEGTLKYLGESMWKRATFNKTLTFEIADVNGSRSSSGSGKKSVFEIGDEVRAELEAAEAAAKQTPGGNK